MRYFWNKARHFITQQQLIVWLRPMWNMHDDFTKLHWQNTLKSQELHILVFVLSPTNITFEHPAHLPFTMLALYTA